MTQHHDDSPYAELLDALASLDRAHLSRWGTELATVLSAGGRLLVAGNGGSAAQAQHLSAELVGRFRSDRQPLSAIALHTDTSSLTAIGNDFGFTEIFSRQVAAHGRPGDVLLTLSTSGHSRNLLAAVAQARSIGVRPWALTGRAPTPLSALCDDSLMVDAESTCTIQECHLVAVHLLCAAVDEALASTNSASTTFGEPQCPSEGEPSPALVILGDLLVDETIEGQVERISPDAPVPVLASPHRTTRPGGAGLAALLAAQDGLDVTLITVHNDDDLVVPQLTAAGVTVINLDESVGPAGTPRAASPMKTRLRADGQTLLRLDWAAPASAPPPLTLLARQALEGATAILVSDYGRGLVGAQDVRAAVASVAGRVPVVWDPHPLGPRPVPGVTVATPNQREAAHFVGGLPSRGLGEDIARARELAQRWGVANVVITRGREGVVMAGLGGAAPLVIPAPVVLGGDPCGAGDRFASTLAAALATGATPSTAVPQAVRAASAFVARDGVARMGLPRTDRADEPAQDAEAMAELIRARGGTVVATGGCFDLLHRGHVTVLEQARQLGDCLIVCLNDDASVTRLKGHPRPLVDQRDRAAVLEALACVDAVVVFAEDTPAEALTRIRPDFYVKGGDYGIENLPERAVVESAGGQVVLLPYLDGRSTTGLIRRAACVTPADATTRSA